MGTTRDGMRMGLVVWASLLGGCAFYPDLKGDAAFLSTAGATARKPDGTLDESKLKESVPMLYCSQSIQYAELCALVTDEELSTLLGDAANTDRTFGYLFVTAGAAAAALSKSGEHTSALKNLAIATGTLVGLRSVAQTDKQRQIATAARNALECMVEAADLAAHPPDKLTRSLAYVTGNKALRSETTTEAFAGTLRDQLNMRPEVAAPLGASLSGAVSRYQSLASALQSEVESAQENAPRDLAAGVIRLRLSVRSQLASSLPSIDDIATTRLTAINSLIGSFTQKGQQVQVQKEVVLALQGSIGAPSDVVTMLAASQGPTDSQVKAAQSLAERCGVTAPAPGS